MAGIETTKSISRTPSGGWRCDLTAAMPEARELIPSVVTGYGDTEQEASWEAIMSFARELSKLSEDDRRRIEISELPDGSRLVGSTTHEDFVLTNDVAEARGWADEQKWTQS